LAKEIWLGPVLGNNRERLLARCAEYVARSQADRLLYIAASHPLLDLVTEKLLDGKQAQGVWGEFPVYLFRGFVRRVLSSAIVSEARPLGPQLGSPAGVVDATGSLRPAADRVAIVRVEQFYPFPLRALTEAIALYPNAKELVWCREEPKNMGGWTFMESRLENLLPRCERPRYIGRSPSASPATGSYAIHVQEQKGLVSEALSIR